MSGSASAPGPAAGRLDIRPATLGCLAAIAALLVPLSLLSQPADSTGPGGKLARLRTAAGLSQADLGDVDPTGETIRFATLGLKNVAVTLLWERANHAKKVEDWTTFSATVEQLTKLQPNFFAAWDFHAHNIAYNTSVEFDDYHDRYAWVIKGIDFLRGGVALNRHEPRLLGRMGWVIGHKIGKSDEKRQFRRLFREDEEFHERDRPGRTLPERDNWLVAREKYLAAQALVDSGETLRTTALIFHSEPMMSAINHAKALEEEGTFGTTARDAWTLAGDEMRLFALREIPTSWSVPIRLGLREEEEARAARLAAELEELLPGAFAAAGRRRRDALPGPQRAALDTPPVDRTEEQQRLAAEAESAVLVTWPEVAREAPADLRDRAQRLAREHDEAKETATIIDRYRDIVNFDFWRAACEAEVTPEALEFREQAFAGDREYRAAKLQAAKAAYEQAFAAWRKVLDASPRLRDDQITADDTSELVGRYRKVLDQLDEPFPKPFVLQDVLDKARPAEGQ